ncbi:MAG: nicotinate (nicotinamide) nucleotide adenylyltransferase [Clostridia bacterium]|nr:nicotinate (nicotinamide) nucleotide adenylyltransferase [Clostridia bacterium]
MRIGIFGGSFDPVHNDHVAICNQFVKVANLDEVIIVPTHLSPFKSKVGASGKHRLEALRLAFANNPMVSVCDYEILQEGKSYTYKTVEYIKSIKQNCDLFFLMGADSLAGFDKWKNPDYIAKNCTIVVAGRSNYPLLPALNSFKEKFGSNIITFDFNGGISSTYVRELLKLNVCSDKYIPQSVLDYLREKGLYQGDDMYKYLISVSKPARLVHTAGVIAYSIAYAKRLGVNEESARVAALLHDVAKYLNAEDYPNCVIEKNVPKQVVHQYLGAYIAKEILNVTDEDVLNAIRYHTTGRPEMSLLEKIVCVADLLEPNRTYDEVQSLRDKINADFESGFRFCIKRLYYFILKNENQVFDLTRQANEYYNGKM